RLKFTDAVAGQTFLVTLARDEDSVSTGLAGKVVRIMAGWLGIQCPLLSPFRHPNLIIRVAESREPARIPNLHPPWTRVYRLRLRYEAQPVELCSIFELQPIAVRNFI